CELPGIPEGLQHTEPRVEPEEAIEVDGGVIARARPGDRDAWPRAVVLLVAEGHDDVEAVDGAALKDRDQLARAHRSALRERGAGEKRRRNPEADQCERSVFQKNTSGNHYCTPEAVSFPLSAFS